MIAEYKKLIQFLFEAILVSLVILSVYNNLTKPTLFIESIRDHTFVKKVDNILVADNIEAEYLIDMHHIGDSIVVEYEQGEKTYIEKRELIPYYDVVLGGIMITTVLIYLGLGFYVIRKGVINRVSKIFSDVAFSAALLIAMTWGGINHLNVSLDFVLRFLYDASYILLGLNLFRFSLIFPREKVTGKNKLLLLLHIVIAILLIITAFLIYPTINTLSLEAFRNYWEFHRNIVVNVFLALTSLSIISFIHTYLTYKSTSERQKIRWILIGVFVAVFTFSVLWLIPKHLLGGKQWISEATMILLTLPAPVTMFISIVKYRIFNIDLLISRTTLYVIFTAILFGLYSLIIPLTGLPDSNTIISLTFTTVIALLLFRYFNKKLQFIIDRILFTEKINQRKIDELYSEKTRDSYSIKDTIDSLFTALLESGFFETLHIAVINVDDKKLMFSKGLNDILPFDLNSAINSLHNFKLTGIESLILADRNATEKELPIIPMSDTIFDGLGYKLITVNFSIDSSIIILICITNNARRVKFSAEDTDSVLSKATLAINNIYKINMMRQIASIDEENKKLMELNKMKSWFVSNVSHELKTPLTSIRMFSELLEVNENLSRESKMEYLGIIQNECDRLTRLINNLLDFSKMEKGTKKLNLNRINLSSVLDHTISIMKSDVESKSFTLEKNFSVENAFINGDRDSIIEVFINLISNSMKYSLNDKRIIIELIENDIYYTVIVKDFGIGISQEDQNKIFQPFFRIENEFTSHQGGTGIGLTIVRNIVNLHQGNIMVESEIGKGTSIITNWIKEKYYVQSSDN